jgi:hypothetical protein
MKYYVPVTKRTLPEYLSSGFIGLPASREPDVDIQFNCYPDLLASNRILKPSNDHSVFLLIESSVMCENEVDYFRLKGPISISNIESILFESRNDLDDFVSIYQMMPDIPLQLFDFSVAGEVVSNYLSDAESIKLTKSRKKTLSINASDLASFIIGLKSSFNDLSSRIDFFPSIVSKKIDLAYLSNNTVLSFLTSTGYSDTIVDYSNDFLDLYTDCVVSFNTNSTIEPRLLITKMADLAKDREKTGVYSESLSNKLQSIFDRIDKIMLGYESSPSLSDAPALVLQRAVYLACVAKNIDAIELIKKNTEVGIVVEAISKLLISLKHSFNRLSEDEWKKDRALMNSVLNASELVLHSKKFDLSLVTGAVNTDFSFDQHVDLNGQSLFTIKAQPSYSVGQVVSVLRALGYNPKPDSNGDVSVMHYHSTGQTPLKTIMQITDGPLSGHRKYVKIFAPLASAAVLLKRKPSREKLLKKCSDYMVGLNVLDNTDIMFYRTQLIDTMDREELEHHIKLVAQLIVEVKSEFLSYLGG